MQISELLIRGYGIFCSVHLTHIPSGLVIFHGPNEAGKTTFLGFFRDILFGFPDARSKERTFPPLAGGQHGGKLVLNSEDQGRVSIDRRPGSKGGMVAVTGPNGQVQGHEGLNKILYGLNREVFKNIYAFSLQELQALDSLRSEKVKGALYSAGLGTGFKSFPDLRSRLDYRREELYKPKGQIQRVNKTLKELEEVRAQLKQWNQELSEYDQLVEAMHKKQEEVQELRPRIASLRVYANKINNMISMWEVWVDLQDARRELQNLPEVNYFPAEGIANYQSLKQAFQNRKEVLEGLLSEKKALSEKLRSLQIDYNLLSLQDSLRSLTEEKKQYQEIKEELLRLEPKTEAKKRRLEDLLAGLGKDWSQERIYNFDLSLFTKEYVVRKRDELAGLYREKERAGERLEDKKQQLSFALQEREAAAKELAEYEEVDKDWQDELYSSLKQDRDRFASAVEEIPMARKDLQQSYSELQRLLRDIDINWTKENLYHFDSSLQAQKAVQDFEQQLTENQKEIDDLEQKLKSLQTRIKEKENKLGYKRQELDEMPPAKWSGQEKCREQKKYLRSLRDKKVQQDKVASRIESLQREQKFLAEEKESLSVPLYPLKMIKTGFYMCLPAFMAVVTISVFFNKLGLAAGLGSLLAACAGILVAVHKRLKTHMLAEQQRINDRRHTLDKRMLELDQELEELKIEQERVQGAIEDLREKTGVKPDIEELEKAEYDVEACQELLQKRQRFLQEVEELQKESQELKNSKQDIESQRRDYLNDRQNLLDSWKEHLRQLKLSVYLSPRAVDHIFARIQTARAELKRMQEREKWVEKLDKIISDYISLASSVLQDSVKEFEDPGKVLLIVDKYLNRVENTRELLKKKELAQEKYTDKEKRLNSLKQEHKQIAREYSKAREAYIQAWSGWADWLEQTGLDPSFTPEVTLEALSKVEDAKALMNEIKEVELQKKTYRQRIEGFERGIREVYSGLERPLPDQSSITSCLDSLNEELQENLMQLDRKRDLEEQIPRKSDQIKSEEKKIHSLEQQIRDLFLSAGAEDEVDFRQKGKIFEQAGKCRETVREAEKQLMKSLGFEDPSSVHNQFQAWDKEGLQKELIRVQSDIEELEEKEKQLIDQIGKLKAQRDRLSSSEDVARLKSREQSLLEDIRRYALRWSIYTMAAHLLDKAKEKFELEQQPQVIQRASSYFSLITGGSYTKIFAPLGQDEVLAVNSKGEQLKTDQLSRGTAEQLYLCLRFGYVENYGQQAPKLPMIMDDVLVNFDPKRSKRTAQAILEIASRSQVLYFTCHSSTVQLFRDIDPHVCVYKMQQGKVSCSD